ncbi:MAG TPA: guanylate kinase [Terriglobales bacterium]|jgi:guanylate kinase|nr:guanylate kinase [Terriglobales bacterium]
MSTVYIISAPSGSGKSTLVNELRKLISNLDFSISYTTRRPRGSEQNGREYFFVPIQDFEEMIARGEFLEHANVFGNYYGTAKRFLEQAEHAGHDLLLDIDVQGAAQVKRKIKNAVSVFILPPDKKTLEWRLRNRSLDAEEVIQRRLLTAAKEIENYQSYDYILINDRLEESIDELKAIVLSERLRRSGAKLSNGDKRILATAERCLLPNIRERLQPILASFALSPTPG